MIGGNTSSSTTSGASRTSGRPGMRARTMPASTSRIAAGIFRRFAASPTAAITTSSSTRIWIVRIMAGTLSGVRQVEYQHLRVARTVRSEEHTSELQSHSDLVCRLLLEKKKELTEVVVG